MVMICFAISNPWIALSNPDNKLPISVIMNVINWLRSRNILSMDVGANLKITNDKYLPDEEYFT